MRNPLRVLAPALVLLSSLPAFAQYSIDKILIHNAAPYSDADVLSVAGLQPGQLLAHDSLGNAAQHVLDTGLFDDAQVDFTGIGKARTVIFSLKPKPVDTLMPTSFVNFVWFTPEELNTALHAKVPLYRGLCSDAGTFGDTIQSALQELLTAKGITATLSHTIVEPTSEYPVRVVSFRVETPSIRIASATYSSGLPDGLSPASRTNVDKYLAHLAGTEYNEGLSAGNIQDSMIGLWRAYGFATAKLEDIQRTIAPSANGFEIAYTARLDAGAIYKVSAITWQPTDVYSAADFTRDATLQPGAVASSRIMATTVAPIIKAYRAKGYIDAFIDPSPVYDSAAHTVAYSLHAVPGEVYHLKTVTPLNLSPEALADFNRGWTMKPGDVYNETYAYTFLRNNTALLKLAAYNANFQSIGDPQTHTIDLTITFYRVGQ